MQNEFLRTYKTDKNIISIGKEYDDRIKADFADMAQYLENSIGKRGPNFRNEYIEKFGLERCVEFARFTNDFENKYPQRVFAVIIGSLPPKVVKKLDHCLFCARPIDDFYADNDQIGNLNLFICDGCGVVYETNTENNIETNKYIDILLNDVEMMKARALMYKLFGALHLNNFVANGGGLELDEESGEKVSSTIKAYSQTVFNVLISGGTDSVLISLDDYEEITNCPFCYSRHYNKIKGNAGEVFTSTCSGCGFNTYTQI